MGWLGRQGSRGPLFLAIGALSAAIAIIAYGTGLFHSTEYKSMDTRFQVRGEEKPPDDIVIVAIDEQTFTRLRVTFPFRRSLHAQAIQALNQAGAAQISYDIQFTEPTQSKEDLALYNAVGGADHVVLATTEVDDQGHSAVLGGDANLAKVGARAGYSAFDSLGSVFRRVELAPDKLESFAVATVESRSGTQVTEDQLPDKGTWIDYYGGPGTFPSVSFADLIQGKADPASFAGKTVVIGATASNTQDVHPQPFGDELMSGPEIQANAIETVVRGAPLASTPVTIDVLLIVGLSLAAALLNMTMPPLRAAALVLVAAGAYAVIAQLAFNGGKIIPVVYPFMGLAISSVGSLAAQYIFVAFDRQRARDTFARFVPEPVVGELLERSGGGLHLGGTREEVTILFSDIRGFTTFSESRSPEDVVEILNDYLGEMTTAILDNGGTLSAFLGDGILAVFGAPVKQEDHAERALKAAREMLGPRLRAFNERVSKQGRLEPFRMGVGLNSGPVMVGMVGSERRVDYTVIGDTVNTASRLEGMTKGTPHSLFLAESTKQRLKESMEGLEYVDEMQIRGRAHGIKVFTDPKLD